MTTISGMGIPPITSGNPYGAFSRPVDIGTSQVPPDIHDTEDKQLTAQNGQQVAAKNQETSNTAQKRAANQAAIDSILAQMSAGQNLPVRDSSPVVIHP